MENWRKYLEEGSAGWEGYEEDPSRPHPDRVELTLLNDLRIIREKWSNPGQHRKRSRYSFEVTVRLPNGTILELSGPLGRRFSPVHPADHARWKEIGKNLYMGHAPHKTESAYIRVPTSPNEQEKVSIQYKAHKWNIMDDPESFVIGFLDDESKRRLIEKVKYDEARGDELVGAVSVADTEGEKGALSIADIEGEKGTLSVAESVARDVSWVIPKFSLEMGEFERHYPKLGLKSADWLRSIVEEEGELIKLTPEIEQSLQNTEMREIKLGDVESLDRIGKENKTDFEGIKQGMESGAKFYAPIVAHREDKPPWLVAGNTRLVASKAYGITPKIWYVKI